MIYNSRISICDVDMESQRIWRLKEMASLKQKLIYLGISWISWIWSSTIPESLQQLQLGQWMRSQTDLGIPSCPVEYESIIYLWDYGMKTGSNQGTEIPTKVDRPVELGSLQGKDWMSKEEAGTIDWRLIEDTQETSGLLRRRRIWAKFELMISWVSKPQRKQRKSVKISWNLGKNVFRKLYGNV